MKAGTLVSFEIPGYKSIVKCRSKSHSKAKRGSGGLICYIKNEFVKGIQYREGKFKLEDRLWLEFNSEFFGLDKYLFLCFIYITPESSCHVSSRDNIWGYLQEEIVTFSINGNIMITGDFNARTGTLLDYINDDSTSYIPLPSDYSFDKFYPRHSQDIQINNYGKELIDLCIASKLHC